ncbi:MAG: DUF882 domain-containing protein [Candidatus Aminicenantes bacterium]|nr:DUF882 domain-containing protein [Candidatus Aminicenantes bacterium]
MNEREPNLPTPELLSRRRFIGLGAAALALPLLSRIPAFARTEPLPPDRALAFFNTHTRESLSIEYCRAGCLVPDSLDKINHILRDHRTGEAKDIDVRLIDLLHTLSEKTCAGRAFHVISGYRSPETNSGLRANGSGVAARSLHLVGKAVDVRVPGLALRDLYKAAVALKSGGVGIYPASDFVHVDIGRVRTW